MINFTYIINQDSLFISNLSTDFLLFKIPKINRVLICSYPLFEQFKVEDFLTPIFADCLLGGEMVRWLPEHDADPVYDHTNALALLVEGHWEDGNLTGFVVVGFRSYLKREFV